MSVLPCADDVASATALLQMLTIGDGQLPQCSNEVAVAVQRLAEEARRLSVPGAEAAVGTELLWRGAEDAKYYDEMRDEDGQCRPAYATAVSVIEQILHSEPQRIDDFAVESLKGFRGDNCLYHIPRMLMKSETDTLVRGIAQRARAFRCFVLDMNKSRGAVMRADRLDCVRSKALPESVFRRVAARAGEKSTLYLTDHTIADNLYWSMWYGPDIIRGPDEEGGYQWYVVEDNLGYVGGFGDLTRARQVLTGPKGFPELKATIGKNVSETEKFYNEMSAHYHGQVAEGERVVLLYYPRRDRSDNEDRRVIQLFNKRGVVAVPLPGEGGAPTDKPRLVVRDKRAVLIHPPPKRSARAKAAPSSPAPSSPAPSSPGPSSPGPEQISDNASPEAEQENDQLAGKEEPVGLVICLTEPCDAEPGHESTKVRSAIEQARSRIGDYEEEQRKQVLKAKRAEQSVIAVKEAVEFSGTDGGKYTLQMEGGKLVWVCSGKGSHEVERINGPVGFNELNREISGNGWSCKPEPEALKKLENIWELKDIPWRAERARIIASELRTAVEKVGQLVGGRVNNSARKALFRLLRQEDKEGWKRLMHGQRGIPGLLEAYYAGGVKIANGPGFELLGDKELCAHVDKLVKHYLGEEPILRTIPTRSFASDTSLLSSVFDDPRAQGNVVVKRVDGRGGDAVWVGARLSRAEFMVARPLVVEEPEAFIVQKYTALSQVDGQLVDLRGPAFFYNGDDELSGGKGAAVSPVLWGRGVPADGSNGKVNISDRGFEFTIATAIDA